MTIITLKLHSYSEGQFLRDLLNRLHIHFEWKEEKHSRSNPNDHIADLFGSWPSEQSSDELAAAMREARVNQTREIAL